MNKTPSPSNTLNQRKSELSLVISLIYLFFLFLGIVYFIGSLGFPMGKLDQPGAGSYPFMVGLFLIATSSPLFFESLRQKEKKLEYEEQFPKGKNLLRVVSVVGTLLAFAILLKPLGYGVCSAVLMAAILRFLGLRSWMKVFLFSVITSGVSYYLFAKILSVPLPQGIFLFY